MASAAGIYFEIGLSAIERAYKASRQAFDDQLSEYNVRWQHHQETADAVSAVTTAQNENGELELDFGSHIGEMISEAEDGLRLVREAFALSLYHYWEKKSCDILKQKQYNQDKIFKAAAQDDRFSVDQQAINHLRLIANCIKHDDGKRLFDTAPEMFEDAWIVDKSAKHGWHHAFRLQDKDVDGGFAAVRSSGPKLKLWAGKPQEITLGDLD